MISVVKLSRGELLLVGLRVVVFVLLFVVKHGEGDMGKHDGSIKKDSMMRVERSLAIASIRIGYSMSS